MAKTRLKAVNMCLRGIGLAPVATTDENDLDAADALAIVNQLTEDVQNKGLWFNKEYAWMLTPDPITGYVAAPGSALSISASGSCRNLVLSQRGNKMYDMYNHTFDLSDLVNSAGQIEFTVITELPFEDMPLVVRTAVAYIARRMFAQDKEVDQARWRFQKEDENSAVIAFQREDARQNKRNSITDNYTIQSFLSAAGGPNAYSATVGTFPKRDT